eukprot:symbB.v1.2.010090.t1/scaffold644.1/size179742/14
MHILFCAFPNSILWQGEKKGNASPRAALAPIIFQRIEGLNQVGPGLQGWNDGEPWLFCLRASEYMKTRRKARSGEALYYCAGVEVLQAPDQIYSCIQGIYPLGGSRAKLPKVILVHFQLPHKPGPIYGGHPADPGCSVVIFFKLKEPVVDSPAARLLQSFLEADHPKVEGFAVSGCLKVVGLLEIRGSGGDRLGLL